MKVNKKIMAIGLVGALSLGSLGVVGAEYLSQFDTADALIDQLGGIAEEEKNRANQNESELRNTQAQLEEERQQNTTATQDMQRTIDELRLQIQRLGYEPNR